MKSKLLKHLLFIIPPLVIVGIGLYFIITTSPFVRYWADDFCAAIPLRSGGFWGAQVSWWNTWTGRYSYIFFLDIFESLGNVSVRFIPVISIILLIVSSIPLFSIEIVLAPLFIIITLINAPNIIQSFYWQVGAFNYMTEFIFFNFFLSLLVKPKMRIAVIAAFLLPLIAGGFSEAYALAQVVAIVFILLIVYVSGLSDKNYRIRLLIAGLLGAMLSIVIMYFAPGNAARGTYVTHPPSLFFVIKSTFYGTKWYLQRMLLVKPFIYSLLLIASGIFISVGSRWHLFKNLFVGTKRMILIMGSSVIAAIASTAAVIFSGYYAESITPPERAMFVAIYMILLFFIFFCFCGSVWIFNLLKNRTRSYLIWSSLVVLAVSVALLSISTANHWKKVRSDLVSYATVWDSQEKVIFTAKQEGVVPVINNVSPVGELDGFVENHGWVLGCVNQYYQLNGIQLR